MKIFRTTPGIWLDPWGGKVHVRKIMEIREVELVEDETVPYDYGYGAAHVAQCRVYVDDLGRKYYCIPPMDFGGSPYLLAIDPATNKERAKFWHMSVAPPAITKKGHPVDKYGVKL